MLLKNGVAFDVPEQILKDFKKTAVFPLTSNFTYWDKENNKKRTINSLHRECVYNYFDKEARQMVELRYCETIQDNPNGKGKLYVPPYFNWSNDNPIMVQPNKPDYYYFLYCHPQRIGSPFRDETQEAVFYLENKQADASNANNKIKIKKMALEKLYDDMDITECRNLAKVLLFAGVDDMSDDEVVNKLAEYLDKDPEKFLGSIVKDSSENLSAPTIDTEKVSLTSDMASLAGNAVSAGVVRLGAGNKAWYIVKDNNENGEKIIGIAPGRNKMDTLIKRLSENKEWSSIIEQRLKLTVA